MWSLMKDIARDHVGIRTDVPFRDLTAREKDLVFHGPAKKYHMLYHNEKTNTAGEMDFTYFNAVYAVENALAKVKDEKGMKRVEPFLTEGPCPDCHGARYAPQAYEICRTAEDGKPYALPDLMAMSIDDVLPLFSQRTAIHRRLQVLHDLGLGYLTLGEETPGLSGGEAQRLKLASEMGKGQEDAVFVFDEPTIGLHPKDVMTLLGVFERLIQKGATVVVIEHDLDVIRNSDYIIDMGPGGGIDGGRSVAMGTPEEIHASPTSITGRYL
ncbi:hypothetical protein [uncultured Selenomonas sp.]|uniref:hypothetical protein n=1 Tax=uncultured Selenomonas sp. TaxID=159275 RepID=UPI0025CC6F63|nr:hypothetical protein [uncultured Selenomonas sp.]